MSEPMARDFPPSVRIVGIDYTINRRVSNLRSEYDSRLLGAIDYSYPKIDLADDMNEEREIAVFWHEIIHGIARSFSVELSEDDTDRIARGVHAVLRDNDFMVGFYTKDHPHDTNDQGDEVTG